MSWWFFFIYLGLQVALGLWLSRRIRSESDYFLAGRRVAAPLIGMSLFATWFGAETCLGAAGAVYEHGLSGARADPLGYTLCLLFMGWILATRLWDGGYLTLGDLYRERYGQAVERLAVLVLVPSSVIWAAAQVRAFGQVVAATTDIDVTIATYLAAAFVAVYTLLGGLLADIVTDAVQGVVLSLGLIMILVIGLWDLGGVQALWTQVEPDRWSLLPASEGLLEQVDRWSVPIMGSLVAQELISRVVAAKSARSARRASYAAAGLYLIIGASPVVLGLLGPALIPRLAEPEQLLPQLAGALLHPSAYALFSCALLSAILSTIDSVLLAVSALLSHSVVVPTLKLTSERAKLLSGRIVVLCAAAVALVIALYAERIYDLVETAAAFGTAGVLVTTLAALFVPRPNELAAVAALLAGLVTTPVAEYVLNWPAPFLTSVLVAGGSYAVIWTWGVVTKAVARPHAG